MTLQLHGRHRASLGREKGRAPAPTTEPGSIRGVGGKDRPPARQPARTELPRTLPALNLPGPPLASGSRGAGRAVEAVPEPGSPQRQA